MSDPVAQASSWIRDANSQPPARGADIWLVPLLTLAAPFGAPTVRSAASAPFPKKAAAAFTFNTASYAVMMAQDLEDFAVGFSLTEGVISLSDAIESVEIRMTGSVA